MTTPLPAPPGSGAPSGTHTTPVPHPRDATRLAVGARGIEMLHGVDMEVTVELGRTRMTVRDLLALAPGAVLELDRAAGSPADLLVNGRLIARGEVVVVDEDFGLRVTEILDDAATA
jgi:flagellar motor switch protein FliN/FliY